MSVNPKQGEIPHLEIIFDDVKNKIPMRSRYMLKDRRKMEEQKSNLTFHFFFDVLIRGHPVLTGLHEINRPCLGDENHVRVGIRSSHNEPPKNP